MTLEQAQALTARLRADGADPQGYRSDAAGLRVDIREPDGSIWTVSTWTGWLAVRTQWAENERMRAADARAVRTHRNGGTP